MNTSYFARVKHIKNPLSISRFPPRWYNGPTFASLAPPVDLLNAYKAGEASQIDYVKVFVSRVLGPLNARECYDYLVENHGEDVTLLCYEKPLDFCHRRIVAAWFKDQLDIDVKELTWNK